MGSATRLSLDPANSGRRQGPGSDKRTLLVSLPFAAGETTQRMGEEAYAARFAYQAFQSLLQAWGDVQEVTQAESRLDYAAWQSRQQGRVPLHLSFLPLHRAYLSTRAANVAYPFWAFPDIPDTNICNNARFNWVRIARRLALILTTSRFTHDAFRRAGVTTPIRVVPVPVHEAYFDLPVWKPEQQLVLPCPCYVFPQAEPPPVQPASAWVRQCPPKRGLRSWLTHTYQDKIKVRLPEHIRTSLHLARRATHAIRRVPPPTAQFNHCHSHSLDLSGVVYTSILNPFDPRKNWTDMLTGFLLALGDCPDATLVIKIATPPRLTVPAISGMIGYYQQLGIRHRCRLIIVPGYLSDEQMLALTAGTTYYLNTSRAEGACLPLRNFLAAGRPGLAPLHTALTDYFHAGLGFVIDSHCEPSAWPHDPSHRSTTTWHRLVWQSLHDQLRTSYDFARRSAASYRARAARAREQLAVQASAEEVWPLLGDALDEVAAGGGRVEGPSFLPS